MDEKIYLTERERGLSGGDLAAILSSQRRDNGFSAGEMAGLLNGGGLNNQWNNPFIYLVWMMFARRMWGDEGNNRVQDAEIQGQLNAIRNQMADNQNSNLLMDAVKGNGCAISQLASNLNCDFNALQGAIYDVRSGIDKVSGQVGFSAERVINAVNMGDCNVIQAIKDCCCQTQQNLLRFQGDLQLQMCQQTDTLRNGQRDITSALTQGFAATAFQAQQDKCDIIRAGENNTQRIIDTLNNHWKDELALQVQDLKFQNSQLKQNQYLASIINGGCGNGTCFGQ